MRGLVGVDRFTSKSQENSGTITVEIEEGMDIDVILANVKNAVDRVASFPCRHGTACHFQAGSPQFCHCFYNQRTRRSPKTLKEIGRKIEDDLRGIDNISQVGITGFPSEEIEIAVRESDCVPTINL